MLCSGSSPTPGGAPGASGQIPYDTTGQGVFDVLAYACDSRVAHVVDRAHQVLDDEQEVADEVAAARVGAAEQRGQELDVAAPRDEQGHLVAEVEHADRLDAGLRERSRDQAGVSVDQRAHPLVAGLDLPCAIGAQQPKSPLLPGPDQAVCRVAESLELETLRRQPSRLDREQAETGVEHHREVGEVGKLLKAFQAV